VMPPARLSPVRHRTASASARCSFTPYGIAYVCAVAAIVISRWGWQRQGGDPDLIYEVAMWGFPPG